MSDPEPVEVTARISFGPIPKLAAVHVEPLSVDLYTPLYDVPI